MNSNTPIAGNTGSIHISGRPGAAVVRAVCGVFVMLALAAPLAHAQSIAIENATVYTEPGKELEGATVVIQGGVVRAVGKKVAIPRGARVINGTDKVVTAGFVAASSRIGLVEVSLEFNTQEGVFQNGAPSADVVHAAYHVTDGYNATSVAIPVVRAQGVTSAITEPVGGLISGASAWVSLLDGVGPDVVVADSVAMYANLGPVIDGSRSMTVVRLRELFDDARFYNRQKRAFERNQTRDMSASRLDLEALQPVLAGRIPLVLRANRSSDILAGIRLARDLGIRVIIEGGTEAWMVADELKAANVGVIIDPTMNLPSGFDQVNVRDDSPRALADAGVAVAIARPFTAHRVGILRQLAGIAVANGMSPDHALAAVTTVPAQMFGVDRGTIAVGKVADVVVWSGDPFELSTRAEHVLIAGKPQDLRNHQTMLFERYRQLPRRK